MLTFLQIRDFAIIDSLELEFEEGFTCITGETGAGKSILVDALALLCGDRADTAAVRDGADKAELIAEFEAGESEPAHDWLKAADLVDGDTCLLRRTISRNGRSRAWINGTAVTLSQISDLGDLLVEIHGQNEHLRLLRGDEQFRLLDDASGYGTERDQVRDRYFQWHGLEQERQALLQETPLAPGERDLLEYQVGELDEQMLPAAEFSALEAEHRTLSRGGELVETLENVVQSIQADDRGAGVVLHRASAQLEANASLDPEIGSAAGMLEEAAINCDEACSAIQALMEGLDLSPERLAELESRLNLQHDLARKHRVQPEQLETVLEQLQERLERAGSLESRLAQLELAQETALESYREAARTLSECRQARAEKLSGEVSALMGELGMEGGRFEIAVEFDPASTPAPRGGDRLAFLVSANRDTKPGPLRKVASGGELSRISLAVKVAARSGHSPTQVFDEVDAGIGGQTAHAVGTLLKSLAGDGQALCVTHLAQVAVFADHQLNVEKTAANEATSVRANLLDGDGRIDEVARMLGGQLSERSRAHAVELLKTATATRH